MKILILASLLSGFNAFADRLEDLGNREVEAANFLGHCSQDLAGKPISVVSGIRGTFMQGILYSFTLKAQDNVESVLEVRWDKSSRIFECRLHSK